MMLRRHFRKLLRSQKGAAIVEMAFALPAFIVLVWMIVQLGLVFRAMSGIQHALGEGARAATLWPVPDTDTVEARMNNAVYGIGPGTFNVVQAVPGTADGSDYLDLEVTYTPKFTDIVHELRGHIGAFRSKDGRTGAAVPQ